MIPENEPTEVIVEENKLLTEETDSIAEEPIEQAMSENVDESAPTDPLQDLEKQRIGSFPVDLSAEDAVYFRNLLNKTEWKGPQQAYLLLMAKAELDNIVIMLKQKDPKKRHTTEVPSAVIESLNFFLGNTSGKGEDSANRLFYASMLLRPSMLKISQIDQSIAQLRGK